MKKVSLVLIAALLVCSLAGCVFDLIKIPNVSGVDESSAKNVLSSNGLIPKAEYVYSDTVAEGNVIRTSPAIGSRVSKNTQVTIFVSKGASYIAAKDARISWTNISYADDKWSFYTPYIKEDTLYIKCSSVSFGQKISWQDNYQKGRIFGTASINDTFDKTIPVSAVYEKQDWKANESQSFTLEIPLSDLNERKPTNIYVRLLAYTGEKSIKVKVSFSMTW